MHVNASIRGERTINRIQDASHTSYRRDATVGYGKPQMRNRVVLPCRDVAKIAIVSNESNAGSVLLVRFLQVDERSHPRIVKGLQSCQMFRRVRPPRKRSGEQSVLDDPIGSPDRRIGIGVDELARLVQCSKSIVNGSPVFCDNGQNDRSMVGADINSPVVRDLNRDASDSSPDQRQFYLCDAARRN